VTGPTLDFAQGVSLANKIEQTPLLLHRKLVHARYYERRAAAPCAPVAAFGA
jgi:hypothetical protein